LQVEGEEDENEEDEPPAVEPITRAQVENVVNQIRQYDPGF
jgi:hypothetical protein